MSKCLNCGAELKQMEGSREKKYCNDICRASYHQKKNKGAEPKYVRYSTFKELKDKFDALVANKNQKSIKDEKTESKNMVKGKIDTVNKSLSDLERKDIEFRLRDWETKKCPSYITPSDFKKLKENSITELKSKLN